MNFEFVENLDGLKNVFKYCKNAEDICVSVPDMSLVSARKSAEVLAKYVCLKAYNESVRKLTFSEILEDRVVKTYLRNQSSLMEAFHYIRLHGNDAAHTSKDFSKKDAVEVLEKLHFAVGEVAKRFGLIKNYPKFNPNIKGNPAAVFIDIKDTDEVARRMYDESVIAKNHIDRLFEEFDELCCPIRFIPGTVDINEIIEFTRKPTMESTIRSIQEYYASLAVKIGRLIREGDSDEDIDYSVNISLLDKDKYIATDLVGFVEGIRRIQKADGFSISTCYHGPDFEYCPQSVTENRLLKQGFDRIIKEMSEQGEKFNYLSFRFYYSSGEGYCQKYVDGKLIDLQNQFSSEIIKKEYPEEWFSWASGLGLEFDFEKYPEILRKLQECVKKHLPKADYENCEPFWEDEPYDLLNDVQWPTKSLREIQDFLDEINEIIAPIKEQCDCDAHGTWYHTRPPFAIAKWKWTKEGFKITGVEL